MSVAAEDRPQPEILSASYYRARYYDPTPGRFVNEDPLAFHAGANFYSYVWNSTPNLSDPSGQFPTWWHHDETLKLAKDVFGPKCADKAQAVADANAAVDSPWWSLLNPLGSAWQYGGPHFPIGKSGDSLVSNAIATCNPKSLGSALHTLQDGFAHPSGPLGPLLHVVTGPLYDWPGGANAAAASGATRAALQAFKDKCLTCCQGGSTSQLVSQ
jgi:RHS repeat-associated protein